KVTLVGANPSLRNAKKVTVPLQVIPVRMQFDDGSVFDPTEQLPSCAGGGNALDLTMQSPLFQNADYGDGPRQFVEEFRRLELWAFTGGGINPSYSVRV